VRNVLSVVFAFSVMVFASLTAFSADQSSSVSNQEMRGILEAFKSYVTSLDNSSDIPTNWESAQRQLSTSFVYVEKTTRAGTVDYTLYVADPQHKDYDSFGLQPSIDGHFYVYANDNDIQLGLEYFPIPLDGETGGYDLLNHTIETRIDALAKTYAAAHPQIAERAQTVEFQRLNSMYDGVRSAVATAHKAGSEKRIRQCIEIVAKGTPFQWAMMQFMAGSGESCGSQFFSEN
jgi:hypothetical protein